MLSLMLLLFEIKKVDRSTRRVLPIVVDNGHVEMTKLKEKGYIILVV
jgi:hypothetical protein